MTTTRKMLIGASLGLAGLALAACTTTPLYGPQTTSRSSGYAEQKLDSNQYRVTFTGRRTTPRAKVEDALMLRAAEVTQASGYTHFVVDESHTDQEVTRSPGPYWGPDPYWGFGGGYGFGYGRYGRFGWYDPFWGRGFGSYWDDNERTRFVAFADIAMLSDAQARGNPHAIAAAEVIANLRNKVIPPAPKA